MFETLGAPELLIILAIVVLLFGAGRVGRLGKDLGSSVKEFRRAIKDDDDAPPPAYVQLPAAGVVAAPTVVVAGTPLAPPVQPPSVNGPQLF